MGWRELLFSFEGRVNRKPYWLIPIGGLLISILAIGLTVILSPTIGMVVAIALYPLLIGVSLAIGVKRLHDREKSGHWLWLFYLGPALLQWISSASGRGSLGTVFLAASYAISVWALIELGFLRGTAGPNRYGPDPLEAVNRNHSLTLPKG